MVISHWGWRGRCLSHSTIVVKANKYRHGLFLFSDEEIQIQKVKWLDQGHIEKLLEKLKFKPNNETLKQHHYSLLYKAYSMLERKKYCAIILQEMLTDPWIPTPTKLWLFYFLGLWKWSEVKVTQSFPSLCDTIGYTVHGMLQARILEFPSPEDISNLGSNPGLPRCIWIL